MQHFARILSIYASDTAGVCSALYELGGLTVVHDASGCNSTYATHDEPRWYDGDGRVYISGLTEMDVVLGNEARLLDDIARTATLQKPHFVALCGSPIPAMTGTDYDALALELEARLQLPVLAMHTNGIGSYLDGAGEALAALVRRFCTDLPKTPRSCNILGATPLDLGLNGTAEAIRAWAEGSGFRVQSCLAMGSSLKDIGGAAAAAVNLVLSASGLPAARVLYERFGIPYVLGLPFGRAFAEELAEALQQAAESGQNLVPCRHSGQAESGRARLVIVGESIAASSLARALFLESGRQTRLLCPLGDCAGLPLLAPDDVREEDEDAAASLFSQAKGVIADPMYQPLCPTQVPFSALPHLAFSGRCHLRRMPMLVNRDVVAALALP